MGKKLLLMCICVTLFVGSSAGIAFAAPIKFKFGHSGTLEHQLQIAALEFKRLVEEKSNGELQVTIFPQAQLGGDRDLAEGIRLGTLETATFAAGNFAGFVPELQVFGLPFLFQTREEVYTLLDGVLGEEIAQLMKAKGFINLASWEIGFRDMTNNVRPIKTPEDMKGLKMRVQESKSWFEFMKCLGAIPTPLPIPEVYSALQQGVVDGQENPIATIYSRKFYEVQKYISRTGHTYEPSFCAANPKWFNSLSEKHQQILREAAQGAAVYERKKIEEQDAEHCEEMKKAGVQIEENPDKVAFAETTKNLPIILANDIPESLLLTIKEELAKLRANQ